MKNKVAKSAIITIGGQKIGLVGGTVTELRSISSPGNIGVSQNLLADIQAAVDGLLALGVNKVIVMTHLQQFSREFELARQLRDVDIIVAGGSHSVFAKPSDRLRPEDFVASSYPSQFTSATGEPVYVVNTGSSYRYVGRLIASFDEAGRLTGFDNRSGAYATDIQGVLDTGNVAPSSNVVAVVTRLANIVDGKDGNRFGRTSVYLNGIRNSVRTEETNLGDLTADANLWRARQTDPNTVISLKNGGGIRDSIGAVSSSGGFVSLTPPPANPRVGKQAGEVSQLDIENSLRFNNTLSLVTLTAQQLRDTDRPITHIAQLHLVETAGHFLAVARNERQGGALGEEGESALNLLRIQREFRRNARDDGGSNHIGHVRGFYASGEPNSTPCVFRTSCAAIRGAHERGCPFRQLQPATALSQSTRHPIFPRDNTAAPRATPSSRPNNRRTSGVPTFRKASRGSATTSSSS